jgi:putative transposase
MNGVNLVLADRWFLSTKLCRHCGCLNEMPLSERTFKCACGHTEDRDVNAAQNLRTLGFMGIYACGQKCSGHRLLVGDETGLVEAGTQSLVASTSCHI